MFIKSLTIKNFRSFGRGLDNKGTKIDFNQQITTCIGRNGSGKTTILEALNFLIGQDYLASKISEKDFHFDADGIGDEHSIIIEGETVEPFFFSVDVISHETGVSTTVSIPCNKIRLSIKRRAKAERVLDDPYIINKTVIPIVGPIDESIYQEASLGKSSKIVLLEEVISGITDLDDAKEIIKDLVQGNITDAREMDGYYTVRYKLKSVREERTASFPAFSLSFNLNRIKGLAKSYYLSKNRVNDVTGNYSLIVRFPSVVYSFDYSVAGKKYSINCSIGVFPSIPL